MAAKRFPMVPVLSSAAKIPFPGATMACAALASCSRQLCAAQATEAVVVDAVMIKLFWFNLMIQVQQNTRLSNKIKRPIDQCYMYGSNVQSIKCAKAPITRNETKKNKL